MNGTAKVISWMGFCIIIFGVIGSFVIAEHNVGMSIVLVVFNVINGTLLIGLAETINLLQENADQSKKIEKLLNTLYYNKNDELPDL